MDATQALAFKLARDDGYSSPGFRHCWHAEVIEQGRKAREQVEAILVEAREACCTLADRIERTVGTRANRDRS